MRRRGYRVVFSYYFSASQLIFRVGVALVGLVILSVKPELDTPLIVPENVPVLLDAAPDTTPEVSETTAIAVAELEPPVFSENCSEYVPFIHVPEPDATSTVPELLVMYDQLKRIIEGAKEVDTAFAPPFEVIDNIPFWKLGVALAGVVVAISLPVGSAAMKVPADIPRPVSVIPPVDAVFIEPKPSAFIVVVAVEPKYAVFVLEDRLEEASENDCNTVHVFECARFKSEVIVPLVVIGVVPIVNVEFGLDRPTEETVAFEVLQVAQDIVRLVPPTNEPMVPVNPRGGVIVRDDVAIVPSVDGLPFPVQ